MNCYNQNKAQAHMTMAALQAIRQFTDQPYEIILIDNEPKFAVRDDYGVLNLEKHIIHEKDPGCYASYNIGASMANGYYLAFIQNDVFVVEGWLDNMKYYIDNKHAEVVFPDQIPRSREYIIESKKLKMDDPEAMRGSRDAGLLLTTRKTFDKIGGWDERIKAAIIGEKLLYEKMRDLGIGNLSTRKAMIIHIMAGTNLSKPQEVYNKQIKEESEIMEGKK